MRDISAIISIGGSGKCGLSASSSERGGISSTALRAEDGQVADVLLPHRDGPAVVGVGLRPIAELMAAQSVVGAESLEVGGEGDLLPPEAKFAKQAADAEQHAAGIIPGDPDDRGRPVAATPIWYPRAWISVGRQPHSTLFEQFPNSVGRARPTMTGVPAAGHFSDRSHRTIDRASTSSISICTAFALGPLRLAGVTMTARVKSRSAAIAVGGKNHEEADWQGKSGGHRAISFTWRQ